MATFCAALRCHSRANQPQVIFVNSAPPPIDLNQIIGAEEAALISGLTGAAIRYAAKRRELNGKLIGKTWIFTRADVLRFARATRRRGPKVAG